MALLGVLALGCGPSASDYPYVRTERSDAGHPDAGRPLPPILDEPLEAWDTDGAGPLSGIFAVEVIIRAEVVVPLEARQLFRLRVVQRDRDVRMRLTPCQIRLPSVQGVATLRLPAALDLLIQRKALEEEGPYLSEPGPVGAAFLPPRVVITAGVELADPVADPLPTAEDPTGQIDEDGDGRPGVTIGVETVLCREVEDAYATIRITADLEGTVEDVDTITGSVEPTLEFTILDISDPCLSAATNLPVEVIDGSAFRAVRMSDDRDLDGNGNVVCEEVNRAAPEIFGEYWVR